MSLHPLQRIDRDGENGIIVGNGCDRTGKLLCAFQENLKEIVLTQTFNSAQQFSDA